MKNDISNLLDYFTDCLNTEGKEAFRITPNKRNIFYTDMKEEFEEFFFEDIKYLDVKNNEEIQTFIRNKISYHKMDNLYLSLEYVKGKRYNTEVIIPLHLTEVVAELKADVIRLSKSDYEPTFNFNLLPAALSENEKLLISEELYGLKTWDEKVKCYRGYIDSKHSTRIISEPLLFLSNGLNFINSSVCQEIEWIKDKYIDEVESTALRFFLTDENNLGTEETTQCNHMELYELNKVQTQVINYALNNPFTVIQGPPGTGKSQVVVNLLASIYLNNQTVLFASKNNKAVNNIIEKLDSIQSNYCSYVRLGNKQEKKKGLSILLQGLEAGIGNGNSTNTDSIDVNLNRINKIEEQLTESEAAFNNYFWEIFEYDNFKKGLPTILQESLAKKTQRLISNSDLKTSQALLKEGKKLHASFIENGQACEKEIGAYNKLIRLIEEQTHKIAKSSKGAVSESLFDLITPSFLKTCQTLIMEGKQHSETYRRDLVSYKNEMENHSDLNNSIQEYKKVLPTTIEAMLLRGDLSTITKAHVTACRKLCIDAENGYERYNEALTKCQQECSNVSSLSQNLEGRSQQIPKEIRGLLGDTRFRRISGGDITHCKEIRRQGEQLQEVNLRKATAHDEQFEQYRALTDEIGLKTRDLPPNIQGILEDSQAKNISDADTSECRSLIVEGEKGQEKYARTLHKILQNAQKNALMKDAITGRKASIAEFQQKHFDEGFRLHIERTSGDMIAETNRPSDEQALAFFSLKSELNKHKCGKTHSMQKIAPFFFPNYYPKRFWSELRVFLKRLPEAIHHHILGRIEDISIDSLSEATELVGRYFEWMGYVLSTKVDEGAFHDSSLALQLQEKTHKEHYEGLTEKIKKYVLSFPEELQSGLDFENTDPQQSIQGALICLNTLESWIHDIARLNELRREARDLQQILWRRKEESVSKHSDISVYFKGVDSFLDTFPLPPVKTLSEMRADGSLHGTIEHLHELEKLLWIICEMNVLEERREESTLKIRKYEKETRDLNYQELFDRIDKYLDALPKGLRDSTAVAKADSDIERSVHVMKKIEAFLSAVSEINCIASLVKESEGRIQRFKKKLQDEYYREFFSKVNAYLERLPDVFSGTSDGISEDNKIERQVSLLTQLRIVLEIVVEINKLRQLATDSKEKIQQYDQILQDQYYQTFVDKVDKHLNMFPIEVKSDLQALVDGNIIKRHINILTQAVKYVKQLMELGKHRKSVNKSRAVLKERSSTQEYMEEYSEIKTEIVRDSIAIFNGILEDRVGADSAFFGQELKDYYDGWKDSILSALFKSLKDKIGIWVTTNLSTRYNLPTMPGIFDYVIIDEASQNDILSIIPLLFRAKKAIILGDPQQLKHITSLSNRIVERIAEDNKIGDRIVDFHYNKNSAYDLAERQFVKHNERSAFALKDHYRCHEDIIGFSNTQFYNSTLFAKTFVERDISPLSAGVRWESVKGNYCDKSNQYEAVAVANYVEGLLRDGLKPNISMGIITPFNNQKNLISSMLLKKRVNLGKDNDRILVSTVHRFQGDEKDVIIYSPVLSDGITAGALSWLDRSTDLLNVAITRARNALVIIGDSQYCRSTNGLHRKLLDYCVDLARRKAKVRFESKHERIFYNALTESGFDFEYQVPIGKYRVDFLMKMSGHYLCVELDGNQHASTKSYDHTKDTFLKGIGYEVKRFPNAYLDEGLKGIVESLKRVCVYDDPKMH